MDTRAVQLRTIQWAFASVLLVVSTLLATVLVAFLTHAIFGHWMSRQHLVLLALVALSGFSLSLLRRRDALD